MQDILRVLCCWAMAIALTTPRASAAPTPTVLVLLARGAASESDRAYADSAIVKALRGHGFIADLLNDPSGDLAILGPALCASTGVTLLLGSTVAVNIQPDREINQWATAKIDVAGYDCGTGRSVAASTGSAATYNWNWALDQAVATALQPLVRAETGSSEVR
jgi:hypothetical protein